ncbi:protein of unknown function [Agreia sp. COWG]|nr:protein of unknown function [Agreia sp. COWG]
MHSSPAPLSASGYPYSGPFTDRKHIYSHETYRLLHVLRPPGSSRRLRFLQARTAEKA